MDVATLLVVVALLFGGQTATWTTERFEAAGLQPPRVEEHWHADTEGCEGHIGLFRAEQSGNAVHLCLPPDSPAIVRQKTVLHEFSHAWLAENLDSSQRQMLVDRFGAASWNDHADPWHLRGTEIAAEVLTWGLMPEPLTMPTLPGWTDARLEAEFERLTGAEPPRSHSETG